MLLEENRKREEMLKQEHKDEIERQHSQLVEKANSRLVELIQQLEDERQESIDPTHFHRPLSVDDAQMAEKALVESTSKSGTRMLG